MTLAAEERAKRSTQSLWSQDDASKWLGMEIVETGPGHATLRLKVERHHTNGHDICHGGIIFSLADSAFGFACNSYNRRAVSQYVTISFIAPARLGDMLSATACEVSRSGRNGIYDVRVNDGDGNDIACFRGCSRIIDGQHFEED